MQTRRTWITRMLAALVAAPAVLRMRLPRALAAARRPKAKGPTIWIGHR